MRWTLGCSDMVRSFAVGRTGRRVGPAASASTEDGKPATPAGDPQPARVRVRAEPGRGRAETARSGGCAAWGSGRGPEVSGAAAGRAGAGGPRPALRGAPTDPR